MKHNVYLIGGSALLIGLIAGYVLANNNHGRGDYKERRGGEQDMHQMADGSMMTNDSMEMGGMHDMTVTSEKAFIEHMIPHHQEAVDTAKEVVARGGTTPEIRTLAETIIVAQEAEISAMKSWYQEWYGTEYINDGSYSPMMRDLEILSGTALDKAFLSDMITHHKGAIMMARSVESHIEHDEVRMLSAAIVTTQTEEIALMEQLLISIDTSIE